MLIISQKDQQLAMTFEVDEIELEAIPSGDLEIDKAV